MDVIFVVFPGNFPLDQVVNYPVIPLFGAIYCDRFWYWRLTLKGIYTLGQLVQLEDGNNRVNTLVGQKV